MTRRGKGEGSIRKLADGRWRARLRVDGVEWNRERRTKAEALRELKRLQVRAGLATGAGQTLEAYLEEWIDGLQLRPRTVERYELDVRVRLVPYLGHVRLDRITAATIQAAYAQMQRDGATAATVQKTHVTLSSALSSAVRWQLLSDSPAKLVDLPEHEPAPGEPLTAAQAVRVLAGARGDRLEPLWWFLLCLGVRWGQAQNLRWEDLEIDSDDPEEWWVRLPSSKRKRDVLRLPLPDLLVEQLRAHRRLQRAERLAARSWEDRGLVFTSVRYPGRALPHGTTLKAWRDACVAAGAPPVRMHDARHSTGSLLAALGVPQRLIMAILGHRSLATSAKYTQQHDPALRQALQHLTDALGRPAAEQK